MCVNYGTRLQSRIRAEVKEPGILHTTLRIPPCLPPSESPGLHPSLYPTTSTGTPTPLHTTHTTLVLAVGQMEGVQRVLHNGAYANVWRDVRRDRRER